MPVPPGQSVLECTIELDGLSSRVWRRLLVPGSVRLDKLHRILQAAMGWEDRHLHMFRLNGLIYCTPFDDFGEDDLDERDVTVVSTAGRVDSFVYEYDFGDSWEHVVTVHSVRRLAKGLKFAVCLDGAGACPPENCGGVRGYQDLLRVLGNPNDPRHGQLREWAGGALDPDEFDVVAVSTRLSGSEFAQSFGRRIDRLSKESVHHLSRGRGAGGGQGAQCGVTCPAVNSTPAEVEVGERRGHL